MTNRVEVEVAKAAAFLLGAAMLVGVALAEAVDVLIHRHRQSG